jgi:hypothetical protein
LIEQDLRHRDPLRRRLPAAATSGRFYLRPRADLRARHPNTDKVERRSFQRDDQFGGRHAGGARPPLPFQGKSNAARALATARRVSQAWR